MSMEEQVECPLCMEPLEIDDINFYPCTCGYQICRFCWHRIRTDENGLCPACRKPYPEDPAEFKPLTEDELQRIKKERRQKDLQRKLKAAENRKHLANVRVVQKNLVFVVGLSQRLADQDVLKKHEYFGKFGKILKVVINTNTSYAGAQGPSASAYVTYHKPEDALRAIQAVNNIHIDGRTLKASLGTTKYCSHFLRGAQCPKPDCMYLHELGEEAASFTKEEMQQGRHQEYEQKLYEQFMNSLNLSNHHVATGKAPARKKTSSPTQQQTSQSHVPPHTSKDAWPSLHTGASRADRPTNGNKAPHTQPPTHKPDTQNAQNRAPGHQRTASTSEDPPNKSKDGHCAANQNDSRTSTTSQVVAPLHNSQSQPIPQQKPHQHSQQPQQSPSPLSSPHQGLPPSPHTTATSLATTRMSPFDGTGSESMSLFSSNGFQPNRNPKPIQPLQNTDETSTTEIPDTIPVCSSTDWQAAFGFTSAPSEIQDDDLGFDPWNESSKGLADLIEKEDGFSPYQLGYPNSASAHFMPSHSIQNNSVGSSFTDSRLKTLPPGFSTNHVGAFTSNPVRVAVPPGFSTNHNGVFRSNPIDGAAPPGFSSNHNGAFTSNPTQQTLPIPPGFSAKHVGVLTSKPMGMQGSSKMLGLMQLQSVPSAFATQNTYHDVLSDISLTGKPDTLHPFEQGPEPNVKDWQEGLRALLPNINISFGAPSLQQNETDRLQQHNTDKNWPTQSPLDLSWDPAVVTTGNVADKNCLSEDPPHWMASLQHLTDESTNHRMPFADPFCFQTPQWSAAQNPTSQPPPGFHQTQIRPPSHITPQPHKLT